MRSLVGDLYVHTMLHCAHEQKAQGVQLIGVANKNAVLRHLWALPNDSKHNRASFSMISTVWLHLRVAQVPRSRDLVIFVLTNRQTDRTDCFTPCCICVCGVIIYYGHSLVLISMA